MDLVGDEDGNIIGSMEPEKDMGLVSEDIERLTQRNLPVSARNLIMMQKENQALRDRIKEVRIILNKQVNDLQDDLKMTKASNENELTRMKIQYGKDLQVLENDYKSSSALVRQQVRQETEEEMETLKKEQQREMEILKIEFEDQHKSLVSQLEEAEKDKDAYYHELQKLKGHSNNMYEGGFGTFTLAFENPFYQRLLAKQAEL